MTKPSDQPSEHTKRLAQAIAVLGMDKATYMSLTVAEWAAICEQWNEIHKN